MMIRIFADFNGVDKEGRVALTSRGSIRDLSLATEPLRPGLRVVIYDHDNEGEAILELARGTWWARIDWATVKDMNG